MTTSRKQVGSLNCVACGKRLSWQYAKAGRHPECAKVSLGKEVVLSVLGPKAEHVAASTGPKVEASELSHEPGVCSYCGGRVRNDDRHYHLRCEEELIRASLPKRTRPLPLANAPRARVCTVCRSRDNSHTPSEECQRCGGATEPAPIVGAKAIPKAQRLEVEILRRSEELEKSDDLPPGLDML